MSSNPRPGHIVFRTRTLMPPNSRVHARPNDEATRIHAVWSSFVTTANGGEYPGGITKSSISHAHRDTKLRNLRCRNIEQPLNIYDQYIISCTHRAQSQLENVAACVSLMQTRRSYASRDRTSMALLPSDAVAYGCLAVLGATGGIHLSKVLTGLGIDYLAPHTRAPSPISLHV